MKGRKQKICVVTGTRAEYGLLKHLMYAIKQAAEFELQVIATGMHLSAQYGFTYQEIEADGFTINSPIDLALHSDSSLAISKSTAIGISEFAKAYEQLTPDLIVVLGDRFEILSAAIAALFARIPIAHLHGGELTEGAMDDAIRHAITKLSHLHFVATEAYKNRVIQLGENPQQVFNVGGLGVDAIRRVQLLEKNALEAALGLEFKEKNILITYHPETLAQASSHEQMTELLGALTALHDTQLIFTLPNADIDNHIITAMIKEFVQDHPNACFFISLGQLRYLSCIAFVDAVVGNSSSGLTEVPAFKKATINIGDRQKGRIQADSIINCIADRIKISEAIAQVYTAEFQNKLKSIDNPYGNGGAVERIMAILQDSSFKYLIKKQFYDLK